jgi:hypothetical protein
MFARARRTSHFVLVTALATATSALANAPIPGVVRSADGDSAAPVRYARDVRPILSNRCFACHGPDAGARAADLALHTFDGATENRGGYQVVVPGDPDASYLLERICSDDASAVMPPRSAGAPLTEREIETLRRWIEQGAAYEPHWSHVAPSLPPLPALEFADAGPELVSGLRNEVDLFVRARLVGSALQPRAEASRAALVRRLCLTLWGLPAPRELVEGVLADDRDDWYERLVDELLASPRHGEHQARQWLDVARYGDTHGLHLDNERAIHPYRDWVIEAFTRNLPYDEFVIQQLAGDLLPDPTQEKLVASGFNRCNPTSAEAGLIAEEYLAKYAWDRVDTTSTAFLGLTMACAKCHDHKFDPFTTRDYYALYSFFDDMEGGASDENRPDPEPAISVATAEQADRLRGLDTRLEVLADELEAPSPSEDEAQREWVREELERDAVQWSRLTIDEPNGAVGVEFVVRDDGGVEAQGTPADFGEYVLPFAAPMASFGSGLSTLRVEFPTHSSTGLVGLGEHGNFALSRLRVERRAGDEWSAVDVATIDADHAQEGHPSSGLLDDDRNTSWAVGGGESATRSLVLALREPAPAGSFRLILEARSERAQHFPAAVRILGSVGSLEPQPELGPWEMAGPVPDPDGGYPLDVDFGPDPGGPNVELTWRELVLPAGETLAWPYDHSVTYVRRRIRLAAPSKLRWRFVCDDSLRVWIDETEVLRRDTDIGYVPEVFEVRCELAAGEHEVLVRIVNRLGGILVHEDLQFPSQRPTESIAAAIRRVAEAPNEPDAQRIREFFRRNVSDTFTTKFDERDRLLEERKTLVAELPRTLISRDRPEPIVTRVLERGLYDHPGEPVESDVPAVFGALAADAPRNRLGLARWIVSPTNPLAARVAVNRVWQQHFGRGLVATPEDFGLQGAWPSHPELLDWLAVRFVEEGWNLAWLHHTILGSATWRQSSDAPAEHWRADPDNVSLARGPRFRVDAEVVRDSALFAAGLLVEKVGGPSVKPYQPDGLWRAVAYPTSNTADYVRGEGEDLYRRSLYTFWKRTSPPASLALLDAPSREFCVVERERTNTPLQALALLNDEQFVEAARVLAARTLREAPVDDASRAEFLVRTCLARSPREQEVDVLLDLLEYGRESFGRDLDAALVSAGDAIAPSRGAALAGVGEAAAPAEVSDRELAAWTLVASTVLNLDEFLNID